VLPVAVDPDHDDARAILEGQGPPPGRVVTQERAIFRGQEMEKLALADQLGADERETLRLLREQSLRHFEEHAVASVECLASSIHSASPCPQRKASIRASVYERSSAVGSQPLLEEQAGELPAVGR